MDSGRTQAVAGPGLTPPVLRPHAHNMNHPVKKKFKHGVAAMMQNKGSQSKIQQPISKTFKQDRLKVVLRNLALLKLLKNPNHRIQELYKLAKACWNSLLRSPRVFKMSSQHTDVFKMVRCNDDKESQEAGNSQSRQKLEADKSARKPEERERSTLGLRLRERTKTKWLFAAKPREKQAELVETNATEALPGQNLTTCPSRAGQNRPPTRDPTVVFLKTSQHRTSIGDMKKQNAESQWLWFAGLPTRIHLPGPRVMCRSSRWRWINRCCTRSCSIELPMYHPCRRGISLEAAASGHPDVWHVMPRANELHPSTTFASAL
ncbi:TP53-target gene 5 protein [Suncus etruscus]|uniref:TP53-target gene 5 protein n=1 Tax=Suncus etruscus TaxID=109475 RepID=UPI00210F4CDF|nr:TP53-target gene 5 protein [Suncus etruscus]